MPTSRRCGANDALYMSIRALITTAVATITATAASRPKSSTMASWLAPANTTDDMAMAAGTSRPVSTAATP